MFSCFNGASPHCSPVTSQSQSQNGPHFAKRNRDVHLFSFGWVEPNISEVIAHGMNYFWRRAHLMPEETGGKSVAAAPWREHLLNLSGTPLTSGSSKPISMEWLVVKVRQTFKSHLELGIRILGFYMLPHM